MNNNGKRKTPDGARQRTTSALIRRITAASAKVAGVLAAALVALCGMPAGASAETEANTGSAPIEAVPESEFEPIGYEASIDFDEIEIVKGFEEAEDVGIYFDHRYSDGDNPSLDDLYLQVKGHPGLAFPIDESTEKGSAALRYTGGTYNGEAFDAIVTISDWTYLEPDCGWENYAPYYEGHEVFQPGVYLSTYWKSLSDAAEGFQNFNFYTVGLSNLTVHVEFVKAGTDEPMEVKGHATCIDLDTTQALEFGGSITGARIVEGNDVLYLENDGTRVTSKFVYLSTDGWKHPDEYKKGLVETFYDTTGENRGKAAEYRFFSGWCENELESGSNPDPQSFFALTPDFLTAPNPDENPAGQTEVVKTADKTEGVALGDEVEYTVDFKAHEQGVNCRVGYRYSALEIVDTLPAEMSYVDGSGYLADENGSPIEGAGVVVVDAGQHTAAPPQNDNGTDSLPVAEQDADRNDAGTQNDGNEENAGDNAVRFVFDKEYLGSMPMKGEHYRFVFKAKLASYPADGGLSVRNSSYALINAKGKTPSNDVDTGIVKPTLSLEKRSDKATYEPEETAHYTLDIAQSEENATAENIVVHDAMTQPGIAEIIEGSVTVTNPEGEKTAAEPSCLRDDEERIVGFSLETDADLAFGETMTVAYDALMHTPGETLENEAGVAADGLPEATDVNTVDIVAPDSRKPAVLLEKDADKDTVRIGETVAYRIVATVGEQSDAALPDKHPDAETDATEPSDENEPDGADGAEENSGTATNGGAPDEPGDPDGLDGAEGGIVNVVISDNSLPEGMPIDFESITARVNGATVERFEPSIEGNGFSARFEALRVGDCVEITYDARANDASIAGSTVVNTAVLTADNLEKPLSDDARVAIASEEQAETPPAQEPSPDKGSAPPESPAGGKFVKTGDIVATGLPLVLAGAGAAVAALLVCILKKRRENDAAQRSCALARAAEYGAASDTSER